MPGKNSQHSELSAGSKAKQYYCSKPLQNCVETTNYPVNWLILAWVWSSCSPVYSRDDTNSLQDISWLTLPLGTSCCLTPLGKRAGASSGLTLGATITAPPWRQSTGVATLRLWDRDGMMGSNTFTFHTWHDNYWALINCLTWQWAGGCPPPWWSHQSSSQWWQGRVDSAWESCQGQ